MSDCEYRLILVNDRVAKSQATNDQRRLGRNNTFRMASGALWDEITLTYIQEPERKDAFITHISPYFHYKMHLQFCVHYFCI